MSNDPATFVYGLNETQHLLSQFDTAGGWQLDRTQVVDGELVSQPGQVWTQAIYDLTEFDNLDLDNGDVSLYWRARADRSQPERAKFFVELDVVDQPVTNGYDEDREIKWNIRPVAPSHPNSASLPYQLYLDPGWQIPHEVEAELQVPDEFVTPSTYENFKLTLSKTDSDTVAVMPYHWVDGAWQPAVARTGSELPMLLSISQNLEGRDFFDSVTVRFREELSALDAFAITQTSPDSAMSSPRNLFFTEAELADVQAAIQVSGSHHSQAFAALKQRVDQAVAMGNNGWQVYDENFSDNNWNYARAWLAREAAFLYRLTGQSLYAQTAYNSLQQMYDNPDPDDRLPDRGYGLARAATGMGLALAYDWAFEGWTAQQQQYVHDKIIEALDAWPSYGHANLSSGGGYGSNWVAVTRGAETVMMLAVAEENNRATRFNDLRFWLNEHIKTAYGDIGLSQEGGGYIAYAGGFLVPAVYALENTGLSDFTQGSTTSDVFDTFTGVDFWQLPAYLGAWDADQTSLQTGVSWIGFDPEGWTSLLLDSVSAADLPYYRHIYDAYRGIHNPASGDAKFDQRRSGTVWSLLYYPTEGTAADPNGVLPHGVQDGDKGGYFFRSRWQDTNDVLVAMLGGYEHHRYAWDQPEAFSLRLQAYETYFLGGPDRNTDSRYHTKLLVDGQVGNDSNTADRSRAFFETYATGGYAVVDGGELYRQLGVASASRHLLTDFSGNVGSALLSTLDQIDSVQSHIYTWQASLGTSIDQGGVTSVTTSTEAGLTTFLMRGQQDSYLKGWVITPDTVTISAADPNVGNSPLKIETSRTDDADIWITMVVGTGTAPTAQVTGSGLNTQLQLGNALVYFDPTAQAGVHSGQIVTQTIDNPLLTVTGTAQVDVLSGNAGANVLWGLGGADTLTGGSGFDQFSYRAPAEGGDTITDFGVDDTIQLLAVGFGLVAEAELTDLGNGQWGQGQAQLTYTNGVLSFDVDGAGPQAAQVLAWLQGNPELQTHQIQLVTSVAGPGDDVIVGTDAGEELSGLGGNDTISGRGGNDVLNGGDGNDVLNGNLGDDTVNGGAGNDLLAGIAGRNVLFGNAGNDVYIVQSLDDEVVEQANEGLDWMFTAMSRSLANHVENLKLINGTGDSLGGGNALDNRLQGNEGNNTLLGYDGNDLIEGFGGNDVLVGGNGADTLVGGEGDDTFVMDDLTQRIDKILDFGDGNDRIDLRNLFAQLDYVGANPVADGVLRFAQAPMTVGGITTQDTFIQIDGDGPGSSAQFVNVVRLVDYADPLQLGSNVLVV